jgi:hypothetical protein
MRNTIKQVLKTKGQNAIYPSILATINDLKKEGYSYNEIKETVRNTFYGIDTKIDFFIEKQGY